MKDHLSLLALMRETMSHAMWRLLAVLAVCVTARSAWAQTDLVTTPPSNLVIGN